MIKENVEIVDPVAQEHVGASCANHVALFSSVHVTSNCIEEERCHGEIDFIHKPSSFSSKRCDAFLEDVAKNDSRVLIDGSIIKYRARDYGFS